MGTSHSSVSTVEKTASDTMVSTVERYAAALDYAVQAHLVPLEQAFAAPAVIVQRRPLAGARRPGSRLA